MEMKIATPKEPVYYYECSAGRYRLVYHIPPNVMQELRSDNLISRQAIEDLPDGADVGCTEPDFAEFEDLYGYRPPHDPEALLRAFFAIFSTTRNWKNFRGSGRIPARDLEAQLETVEAELETAELEPVTPEPAPARATLRQRRRRRKRRRLQQQKIQSVLQELPARGVDPHKTLGQQEFSKIEITEGKPAEEIFSDLHLKQRR